MLLCLLRTNKGRMVPGKKNHVISLYANVFLPMWLATISYIFRRYGTWGICFTQGAFFAVKALVDAGRTYDTSSSIRKACNFLLSKQQTAGGWGESCLSSETGVNFLSCLIYICVLLKLKAIQIHLLCTYNCCDRCINYNAKYWEYWDNFIIC